MKRAAPISSSDPASRPRIALIGAPTDINSSFLRGSAKAPPMIRAALHSDSGNMASELGGTIGEDVVLVDRGDLSLDEGGDDDARITRAITTVIGEGLTPLSLGGDHAITYPILRAVAAHHGPVTILHFDAHPDLYDELGGNRRSHASPFARIMEDGLASRLVQVGIRTLTTHQREQADRFGVEIVPMRRFTPDKVPSLRGPVYVSIDLDAFDPSIVPGVSHHEPGGLTVREVLDCLDAVTAPIVGADIVEYNPVRDLNGMTATLAAKLVREMAALAVRNAGL